MTPAATHFAQAERRGDCDAGTGIWEGGASLIAIAAASTPHVGGVGAAGVCDSIDVVRVAGRVESGAGPAAGLESAPSAAIRSSISASALADPLSAASFRA